MRGLLDNNLHARFGREFGPTHEYRPLPGPWMAVHEERNAGPRGRRPLDAMLTTDKNMAFQTSLRGLRLAVLVLDARSNGLAELRRFVPGIEAVLPGLRPGEFAWLRLDP